MEIIKLGGITCVYDDCMDYMPTLPDKSFDLSVVDIPYGIGADKPTEKPNTVRQTNGNLLRVENSNYKHKNWDKLVEPEYFEELKRVSKNQIIFGANYYKGVIDGGLLVWDKLNGDCDQFGCEIASVSLNKRTDIVYYMWSGMMQGKTPSTRIDIANTQEGNKALNQKRIHPTEKPIKLYKWILQTYAKKGQKILDTHGGSFALAIACHDLGFELTIIENDKDHFITAVDRLKQHQQQLKLF